MEHGPGSPLQREPGGQESAPAEPSGRAPAGTPDVPVEKPTSPMKRIVAIDALRGFAVLGIIFVNVWAFALPSAAYLNPSAYGDLSGLNGLAWGFTHLFFEQKFITIFSALFGVGVLIFTDRLEAKGRAPGGLHYRRMAWLGVFGLLHAYLLWFGDILVLYAMCGLLAYLARRLRPDVLFGLGAIPIVALSLLFLGFGAMTGVVPAGFDESMQEEWSPPEEEVQEEVDAYQGSWSEQSRQRVPMSLKNHFLAYPLALVWHTLGIMLLGMGLYRVGAFSGRWSNAAYGKLTVIGLGVGVPLVATGIALNVAMDFRWDFSMTHGEQFNHWGSLFMAGGYLGGFMLLARARWSAWIVWLLAPVGRMAFTNYILQTLIATTIFYGHGFGLFGQVDRFGLLLIAASIAVVQIPISHLWLHWARYGPLEWLWRSLTYRRPASFKADARSGSPAHS